MKLSSIQFSRLSLSWGRKATLLLRVAVRGRYIIGGAQYRVAMLVVAFKLPKAAPPQ
jgi:hypothetical protein